MAYFCSLLVAGAGLLMILKPTLYWSWTESWKSNGTKPSAEFLDNTRIKGWMYIGIAVLLLLMLIFL